MRQLTVDQAIAEIQAVVDEELDDSAPAAATPQTPAEKEESRFAWPCCS